MSVASQRKLVAHVAHVRACTICPKMHRPAVAGEPVRSKVLPISAAVERRPPHTTEKVTGSIVLMACPQESVVTRLPSSNCPIRPAPFAV